MSVYTPEQAAQINWDARWMKYRIPVRFRGLGLADMQRTRQNTKALDQAQEFIKTWPQRRHRPGAELPEDRSLLGRGAIAIGPYGTGKTRLVCAIATDIARTYSADVLYVPVAKYFAPSPQEMEAAAEIRRLALRVPLLIWDDQGAEYQSGSGWVGSQTYRIFRGRFDEARPTLVTSNLRLNEWAQYQGSLPSFMNEAFDPVVLDGEDWRRARR